MSWTMAKDVNSGKPLLMRRQLKSQSLNDAPFMKRRRFGLERRSPLNISLIKGFDYLRSNGNFDAVIEKCQSFKIRNRMFHILHLLIRIPHLAEAERLDAAP